MSDISIVFFSCMALGCLVGFLAGLLGIGGGLIIVPVLSYLLLALNLVPADQAMVVAIATSLASIIFTSSSSAYAHHKNQNIPWKIAPWVLVGVSVGALLSGVIATGISNDTLQLIFASCVIFIALRMILPHQPKAQSALPHGSILTLGTSVIGAVSGMVGIGGGALLVPFLTHFKLDMRKAIGCAALSGILIATFGVVGYISLGLQYHDVSEGFIGFVYLPALIGIVLTSAFFAQFGAKAAQYLPVKIIKRIFAALLVIVAIRMLSS
ncbi:MAG: sulfite exporter TauE/SafE family protein [Pseudoalteromonas spongiae]|uniref:Probable membrane transporter protein n=1 Tax=Pseudoalteromonas spongiae TaxID=298657 RepID=A0ABU8ERI5_9GAMM|nr:MULTISPECIES: sulfite exporter TauE/SafE family protein [Pseudoalteromonas]ATC98020.1 hypothetical protein PSPO_a0858 [Pseudoalteromonas spongiae UST010723-006]KPV97362.1 Sulfite exporter TauE/SafE [Pseudoalteromonas sp. P1-9]